MSVKDVLGNEFKQGQIVLTMIGQTPMLAQVIEVTDGGLLGVDKGSPMQMPGRLVLQVILPIEFNPARGTVDGVWVIRQPKDLPEGKLVTQ